MCEPRLALDGAVETLCSDCPCTGSLKLLCENIVVLSSSAVFHPVCVSWVCPWPPRDAQFGKFMFAYFQLQGIPQLLTSARWSCFEDILDASCLWTFAKTFFVRQQETRKFAKVGLGRAFAELRDYPQQTVDAIWCSFICEDTSTSHSNVACNFTDTVSRFFWTSQHNDGSTKVADKSRSLLEWKCIASCVHVSAMVLSHSL